MTPVPSALRRPRLTRCCWYSSWVMDVVALVFPHTAPGWWCWWGSRYSAAAWRSAPLWYVWVRLYRETGRKSTDFCRFLFKKIHFYPKSPNKRGDFARVMKVEVQNHVKGEDRCVEAVSRGKRQRYAEAGAALSGVLSGAAPGAAGGCCCWDRTAGRPPRPRGRPSPLPQRRARGPRGFWRAGSPGRRRRRVDFLVYDEASGELLTVSEEEFLPGALACEMDLSAPREALKAQAVAILTLYGAKRGLRGGPSGRGLYLPHGGVAGVCDPGGHGAALGGGLWGKLCPAPGGGPGGGGERPSPTRGRRP